VNLADITLNAASGITRNIAYFRGLGRLYRVLNAAAIKLGAQPLVTVKMKDGTTMRVDIRSNTELDAYYRGEYDSSLIKIISSMFRPDLYFLDVGANVGFYTIPMGALIRSKSGSGRVIGFEPFEGNYKRLLDNLKVNELNAFCSIHNFGLSNDSVDGLLTLREDFLHGSNTGNAAIATNEKFDEGFRKVTIKLERLDHVWPKLYDNCGRIDIMKIDIEGHEDFCLNGGRQIIKSHRPTILMEVNKPFYNARGVNLDDIFLPLIPEKYLSYRQVGTRWKRINSLNECGTVDNVFMIPTEKSNLKGYEIFR